MSSKRQTTMAKMLREQAVRERRARKLERKQERKDNKLAAAATAAAAEGAADTLEPSSAPTETEVADQPDASASPDSEEGVGWPLRAPGQRTPS